MGGPAAISWGILITAAGVLLSPASAAADAGASLVPAVVATGEADIDAGAAFEQLVVRYRALELYRDVTDAEYVTTREGEDPNVVSNQLRCHLDAGALRVETAGSQVRGGLGIDMPLARSSAVEALVMRYNLWLAPHLTLKFSEAPLEEFRLGVSAGFRADDAAVVELEGREYLRLVLLEQSPENASPADLARFVLFVNPHSGLIERIEGEQVLPDGARYSMKLRIAPVEVR